MTPSVCIGMTEETLITTATILVLRFGTQCWSHEATLKIDDEEL